VIAVLSQLLVCFTFRRQLAKFDLISFCVNFLISIFFLYNIFCVITIVLTVLRTHFTAVSVLWVLPLSINPIGKRDRR